ncbi:MAG: cyanophycinase [Deinococcales bacterium]|nr:cyanophycinase [Deinococcales bacterium]
MAKGEQPRRGHLLLIGGAERREPEGEILQHFVRSAGGKKARILVCGAATREPQRALPRYKKVFEELGAAEVVTEALDDRHYAEDERVMTALEESTALFFTGGDQLRLTTLVSGTPFGERIRERHNSGGYLIAGTSAGATAMGSVMIEMGPGGGSVRRSDVRVGIGLGYLRDVMIDTHFNERGRSYRFLTVFAMNSQTLAMGIDEDTAVDVRFGEPYRVLGSGAVTIFDGRIDYTNAADAGEDDILAVSGVKVHVLPRGYGFDPKEMRMVLPKGAQERPAARTS